ncbi:CatB-related O-acetyltransferase [Anaerocellum diazotrophicum]|uniref:Acetyltransferase n=1 Tax=Caldicellulosiruptor diazotrophicus TaxID=2806205 RepID=A0ABN6E4S9_9FIRM|nr:CatB-related O-acetyltransferase [Caldicellulosiruptor diazotrophicus]BCS80373.1 acetyltransferase [Caldicellulosiruptor diazotrophicus]
MDIKVLLPRFIKLKIKQIYFYKKYGAKIYSVNVDIKCKLSKNTMVYKDVHIGKDVIIGDYTYVNCGSVIESGIIGKYCSIGPSVKIEISEHPYHLVSTHPFLYERKLKFISDSEIISKLEINKEVPIIGNDVWIGANAIILRGVKIGDGAVIGAGAVVTKDVEPYSIVGGVPARLIKWRFPPEIREKLLRINWWDWPEERIKENIHMFYDVEAFCACFSI